MLNTMLNLDANLFTLINSYHTAFLDKTFLIITQFGSGWIAIPLVAILLILKTQRKYLANALICAALAGTFSGVLNSQIKHVVNRDRPVVYFAEHDTSAAQGSSQVHVVGEVLKRHSFPSGHSNTIFTAATLLALFFGGWYYLGYVPAILVALSRVYAGVHFPIDTLAGALLGMLIAVLNVGLFRWWNILPRTVLVKRGHDKQ